MAGQEALTNISDLEISILERLEFEAEVACKFGVPNS